MRRSAVQSGQTSVEAMIMVAVVAFGLLAAFPYIRSGIAWMWKSAADQVSGFIPYHP